MKALPVIKKIFAAAFTALFVAFVTFLALYLSPGDPAEMIMMEKMGGNLNWDVVKRYAEIIGTNQGFWPMFRHWFFGVLKGDFGTSYKTAMPVLDEFKRRIGCSASLALLSSAISLVVGVSLGILSAKNRNKLIDRLSRLFSSLSIALPSFWLAILFLWLFAMKLRWFPTSGYSGIKNLILPALVTGISSSAGLIRVTRGCVLQNMAEGYVTTARAKGISENRVFFGHILKNIVLPIITMLTASIISMMGGSVIMEKIFGLPGVGNFLLSAIKIKDFPVIMGFVFLLALIVVGLNLIAELLYYMIDPRVRQGLYEKQA